MRFLERFTEFIASVQVFGSPFLAGLLIGGLSWAWLKNSYGLILFILFILIGTIAGLLLLRRVKRKDSAADFMSKVNRFEGDKEQ